jgi:hypothetical protein
VPSGFIANPLRGLNGNPVSGGVTGGGVTGGGVTGGGVTGGGVTGGGVTGGAPGIHPAKIIPTTITAASKGTIIFFIFCSLIIL